MDVLRRSLAPITTAAWNQLDAEAAKSLRVHLSGRRFVDVAGPHGWEYAALNLGRVTPCPAPLVPGVATGIRAVQPLIELRARFALSLAELDDIARGAERVNLGPLDEAARAIARAEDEMIYGGFEPAGVSGVLRAVDHPPIDLGPAAEAYPERIAEALLVLRHGGIGGPYALVVGEELFRQLAAVHAAAYPLFKRIEQLVDGPVLPSSAMPGGLLVSQRGGDFELTLGSDLVIGYEAHTADEVTLYLTESLTFRVLEPAAAVILHLPE